MGNIGYRPKTKARRFMSSREKEKWAAKVKRYCHWISKRRRYAIYLRDGFACLCCGKDLRYSDPSEMGLDHLIPRSAGGKDKSSNIVTTCRRCNSRRGDMPWQYFYPQNRHALVNRKRKKKLDMEAAKKYLNSPRQLQLLDGISSEQLEMRFTDW